MFHLQASELAQMGYMSRLRIWGEGTAFTTSQQFAKMCADVSLRSPSTLMRRKVGPACPRRIVF